MAFKNNLQGNFKACTILHWQIFKKARAHLSALC